MLDKYDWPEEVLLFVNDTIKKAESLGVTFQMSNERLLPYNGSVDIPVSGFFVVNPKPLLGVATGKPFEEWLPILIHESCHMDQWAENADEWTNNMIDETKEAADYIDEWIAGNDFWEETLDKVFLAAKNVEKDCEKRTIEKIEKYNLPINKEIYAQKSNAYVHFYEHIRKTRKWWSSEQKPPYEQVSVWGVAPKQIVDTLPLELSNAFDKEYGSSLNIAQKRKISP